MILICLFPWKSEITLQTTVQSTSFTKKNQSCDFFGIHVVLIENNFW